MSESASKPVFLVDARSEPVVVRIDGRACFSNSNCLRDFVTEMVAQGKRRFVLDFQQCGGVDSTFLGVLAGAAIALKKTGPDSSFVAARVGDRNLELMRNLGLHRLLTIDMGDGAVNAQACQTALDCKKLSEIENARLVLEAHETLGDVDETNRAKFQDVVTFLRARVQQG